MKGVTLEKAIAEKIRDETGWVYSTALIRVVSGLGWLLEDTGKSVLSENRNRKMLFNS